MNYYLGLLFGIFLLAGCSSSSSQIPLSSENTPQTILDSKSSKTLLVEEFSDIECPACRRFAPEYEAVESEFSGKVIFKYYHFPLEQIHPLAYPSSIAVECMGALAGQEKRNQYLHMLFAAKSYSSEVISSTALTFGVDMNAFETCRKEEQTKNIVKAHIKEAISRGVRATPTLFINGEKIEGGMSRDDLKKILEEKMKQ